MNNTLKSLLLASSLTTAAANAASLDQETNEIISDTESYISNTLDVSLPQEEFDRQFQNKIIITNWDYSIIQWDENTWYTMTYANIDEIPLDSTCKNYSWVPVFYVKNANIKQIDWEINDPLEKEKFEEFKKMPSCDTAWVKTLASNIK